MMRKPSFSDDPVVAEVRAIRAAMWREAGGTVEGYLRLLDREAKTRKPASSKKPRQRTTVVSRRRAT